MLDGKHVVVVPALTNFIMDVLKVKLIVRIPGYKRELSNVVLVTIRVVVSTRIQMFVLVIFIIEKQSMEDFRPPL